MVNKRGIVIPYLYFLFVATLIFVQGIGHTEDIQWTMYLDSEKLSYSTVTVSY